MTSAPTLERPPTRTSQCRRSPSTATSADRPKTVLFCPCGREAATDEWHVERDDGSRRLVCPDCGETLTVR